MEDKEIKKTLERLEKSAGEVNGKLEKLDKIWTLLVGDEELHQRSLIEEHNVLVEDYNYRKDKQITGKTLEMYDVYDKSKFFISNMKAVVALIGISGISAIITLIQQLIDKIR